MQAHGRIDPETVDVPLASGEAIRVGVLRVLAHTPEEVSSSLRLPVGDLAAALAALGTDVAVVAVMFASEATQRLGEVTEPVSYQAMVEAFDPAAAQALVAHVPATESVKRVLDSRMVESVDRATLVRVRAPEVLDRAALAAALAHQDAETLVDPAALVAASGGTVALYAEEVGR